MDRRLEDLLPELLLDFNASQSVLDTVVALGFLVVDDQHRVRLIAVLDAGGVLGAEHHPAGIARLHAGHLLVEPQDHPGGHRIGDADGDLLIVMAQ